MAQYDSFNYAISQSLTESFQAATSVEFSFLTMANRRMGTISEQSVDLYYTLNSQSINWVQVENYPKSFFLATNYVTKSFTAFPTQDWQGVKAVITGSVFTASGQGVSTQTTLDDIELDYDRLEFKVYRPRTELTQDGLFVFRSPSRYIRATKDGIEIKGGLMEVDKLKVEQLEVYGDATIFGDFLASPIPPYEDTMIEITTTAGGGLGSSTAYARGDHTHELPFTTLNAAINNQTFSNPLKAQTFILGTLEAQKQQITGSLSVKGSEYVELIAPKVFITGSSEINLSSSMITIDGDFKFTGADQTIDFGHNTFTGINNITIQDAGYGEGLKWGNSNAKLYVNQINTTDNYDAGSDTTSTLTLDNSTISGRKGGILLRDGGNVTLLATGSRVGIGTTSPESTLTIKSNKTIGSETNPVTAAGNSILTLTSSAGVLGQLSFDNNEIRQYGSNLYMGAIGNGATQYGNVYFQAGVSGHNTRMFISASGNIGIGTLTPSEKLEVIGNISSSGTIQSTGNISTDGDIQLKNTKALKIENAAGTSTQVIKVDSGDDIYVGHPNFDNIYVQGSGGTLMTLLGSGNVGIGTTSPGEKLEVVGNISSSATGLFNKVGIGTIPVSTRHLHISSSGVTRVAIDGASGNNARLHFNDGGTDTWNIGYNASDSTFNIYDSVNGKTPFKVYQGTTSNVLVVSGGRVGIRTTSPTDLLEIHSANSEAYHYPLVLRNPFNSETSLDYGVGIKFRFDDNSQVKGAGIAYEANSSYGNSGDLKFYVDENNNTSPVMTMQNGGNVGIGTTNPTYELDVVGDIGVNQYIHHNDDDNTAINFTTDQIQLQTAGATGFTLDSSQRIGIGTTSPSQSLDVNGEARFDVVNYANNVDGGIHIVAGNQPGSDRWEHKLGIKSTSGGVPRASIGLIVRDAAGAVTNNNYSESISINSTGKVGIGTTSPQELLHIAGTSDPTLVIQNTGANQADSGKISFREADASTERMNIRYDGADNKLIIDTEEVSNAFVVDRATGNIGIGTTSPTEKLDVRGNLIVSSSEFKGHISASGNISASNVIATSVDINGGTIDGTTIGENSHTTIKGTTIDATTNFTIGGTVITNNTITDDGTLTIASSTATSFNEGNITNVGNIALDTISSNGATSIGVTLGTDAGDDFIVDTDTLVVEGDNNRVGIGTTAPSHLLHITGSHIDGELVRIQGPDSKGGTIRYDRGDKYFWRAGVGGLSTTNSSIPLNHFGIEDGSGGNTVAISISNASQNVGIGVTTPSSSLHIRGGGDGQAFGGKEIGISENWTTILTIGLADHESAYVKMTMNGIWSNHSGIMFLAEYFISNGAGAFNEPGQIIRQVENTGGADADDAGDTIRTRLVSSGDTVKIEAIIIEGTANAVETATAKVNFHIMGEFDTIS